MQTPLVCLRCGQIMARLPGEWRVVRQLEAGENSRPGFGTVVCAAVRGRSTTKRVCRAKHEVQQLSEAIPA